MEKLKGIFKQQGHSIAEIGEIEKPKEDPPYFAVRLKVVKEREEDLKRALAGFKGRLEAVAGRSENKPTLAMPHGNWRDPRVFFIAHPDEEKLKGIREQMLRIKSDLEKK